MHFGVDFFGFICLEFIQLLELYKLVSFAKCAYVKFSTFILSYFFQYFFSYALFLLSFQDPNDMNIKSSGIGPLVPEAMFSFSFSVQFLCCSDWIMSIFLFSSSPILSSVIQLILFTASFYFGFCIFKLSNSPFNSLYLLFAQAFFAKTLIFLNLFQAQLQFIFL